MNKRQIGTEYEDLAATYLERRGIRIIMRNFRCRSGEIDLIGTDEDGTVVFAEVKYRTTGSKGAPEEAVTVSKRRTIIKVAEYFLLTNDLPEDTPCRFDVVAIEGDEIRHYENAFGSM